MAAARKAQQEAREREEREREEEEEAFGAGGMPGACVTRLS